MPSWKQPANKSNINRRHFVALCGSSAIFPAAVQSQTTNPDVVIVGAGAAGMTGAVAAHQLGGSVLVVEKESVYGGTTAKSGGVAWIPGNHRQAEVQVQDSVDEGYAYLKGLIGDSVSDARIKAYATRAREMLQFMMQHSHVSYSALPKYMDYYEHLPGSKTGGRSMDNAPIDLRLQTVDPRVQLIIKLVKASS